MGGSTSRRVVGGGEGEGGGGGGDDGLAPGIKLAENGYSKTKKKRF